MIERSVVSNGGITAASAGQFTLSGTIGQAVAGQPATNPPTNEHAGFWNPIDFVPTATMVSISGKVTTPDGRGLRNATVTITDPLGAVRSATTSAFGFYQFDNVEAGKTYLIRITSRLYRFNPLTMSVSSELTNIDFVGME